MTRTQVKKELQEIMNLLNEAQERLDNLAYDVESTIDEIEPYENHDDLTEQQEERKEALENALDVISEEANNLTDVISNLEYAID